jgi:hypothetical protein
LTTWNAAHQEEAMLEQFIAEPQEKTERRAWKRIRRAAAKRIWERADR